MDNAPIPETGRCHVHPSNRAASKPTNRGHNSILPFPAWNGELMSERRDGKREHEGFSCSLLKAEIDCDIIDHTR